MGQIPNKTYTAPDGSVYRVDADGSVTKIKNGRIHSNESPSKYNITPDGKIYRVEDDGSVTFLGNAEDRHHTTPYERTTDTNKSSRKWIWIIILVAIVCTAIGIYVTNQNSKYDNNYYSSTEQYPSAAKSSYENPTKTVEYADYDAQYAFIVDGNFYGTIGNTRIHGNLTLDTENPSGMLYYSDTGNGEALELYGSSDCKTWYEYYNDNNTGRIDFSFWDLAYKNFARGTYTRASDGKQFSIKLYKTNL